MKPLNETSLPPLPTSPASDQRPSVKAALQATRISTTLVKDLIDSEDKHKRHINKNQKSFYSQTKLNVISVSNDRQNLQVQAEDLAQLYHAQKGGKQLQKPPRI